MAKKIDSEEGGMEAGPEMKPEQLLREDHRKVKELFERFEKTGDESEKKRIVATAIKELKIHTSIEEEIYYPAVREELGEEAEDLMDEALEEHHVAKMLIEELEGMEPGDEHFDAKFTVLAENVKHHIQEEESEMLPKAEKAGLDDLTEEMMERKQELEGELESPSRPRRSRTRRKARKH